MTRQIKDFHPANYSIEADVYENEDVHVACNTLQELTIQVLYRDQPKTRDSLIQQLCVPVIASNEVESVSNKPSKKPMSENDNFLNEKETDFGTGEGMDFFPEG